MADAETETRAVLLAETAHKLNSNGDGEATRALREALSLAPNNDKIQHIAQHLQAQDAEQPLLKWCRSFTVDDDLQAGQHAALYVAGSAASSTPSDDAAEALKLLLEAHTADEAIRDDLVAGLIQRCIGARRHLAKQLQNSASVTFATLFDIGDGAANGITVVSLDATAWSSESVRRTCEKDVFLLFLAKLLESGHDNDGRALKGISRHLAVDARRLHADVDEGSFDAILVCLDYRLSEEVRGQATVATAKYLEASGATGQEYVTRFITTRASKHGTEDLVLAFSAAAALFPIATQVIAGLFLIEGFLASLVPLLDKKSRPIKVEKAALDMLNAACIDAGCREAISKYCTEWMHHVMEDEEDERHGQAALILAKVQSQPGSKRDENGVFRRTKEITDVVPKLKEMFMEGTQIDQRTGIEGLAYASMQASVKQEIVQDTELLLRIFRLPKKDSMSSTTAFGFLTLIDNLTRYLPVVSAEQKKMSELKAYANASTPESKPHELDEDGAVSARCKKCIDAGLVPFLVTLKNMAVASPLSPTCLGLMAKIILYLSKAAACRGILAQQGAIPLVLQIYATQGVELEGRRVAAHALARVLISTDPALIPGYTSSCVKPLLSLLSLSSGFADDQPRDLLPTFEALLALTNLASNPSLQAGASIAKSSYGAIEDLLLHSNTLVQRAATELICNLASIPEGLEKLADGSTDAARRLNILIALADAADVATRRAAGGALAGATEFPGAVHAVLQRKGGVKRVVEMTQDEDEGCVHRGAVCVRNLACCEGDVGAEARAMLKAEGAVDALKRVVQQRQNRGLLEAAAGALKSVLGDA